MEIKTMLEDLVQLERDSAKLQEIKRIMHNDGSIDIIEQITHLQNNTQANNINYLRESLDKIEDKLDRVDSEFRDSFDSVSNAIGYLEEVTDYSECVVDATQAIGDLKSDLDTIAEDSKWKEDSAVQVTNNENGKAIKIEDITEQK
jgi:ADP-ribosylglycohydrolase